MLNKGIKYSMTDINQIKARFDHTAAKKILKEKYESKMLFSNFGGLWKASPELINVLTAYTDNEIYLVDLYENPCKVDRKELLTQAKEIWQEQLNGWEIEYTEIMRQR